MPRRHTASSHSGCLLSQPAGPAPAHALGGTDYCPCQGHRSKPCGKEVGLEAEQCLSFCCGLHGGPGPACSCLWCQVEQDGGPAPPCSVASMRPTQTDLCQRTWETWLVSAGRVLSAVCLRAPPLWTRRHPLALLHLGCRTGKHYSVPHQWNLGKSMVVQKGDAFFRRRNKASKGRHTLRPGVRVEQYLGLVVVELLSVHHFRPP